MRGRWRCHGAAPCMVHVVSLSAQCPVCVVVSTCPCSSNVERSCVQECEGAKGKACSTCEGALYVTSPSNASSVLGGDAPRIYARCEGVTKSFMHGVECGAKGGKTMMHAAGWGCLGDMTFIVRTTACVIADVQANLVPKNTACICCRPRKSSNIERTDNSGTHRVTAHGGRQCQANKK